MNSEQTKEFYGWPPISARFAHWAKSTSNTYGGLYYADENNTLFRYMTWAARSLANMVGSKASAETMPRIEIHIMEPRTHNAVVAKDSEGYNIGIFQGLVFNAVTADMKLHFDLPKPIKDLKTLKYAGLMLHFVCAHEITHVQNGHVDFKHERMLGDAMAEAVSPADIGWALISQTLEFDADAGGFQAAATSLLGLHQSRTPSGLRFEFSLPIEEMIGLSRVLGRAIASHFLMSDGEKSIPDDAWTRTHPPAIVRCKSVSALFVLLLSQTTGLPEEGMFRCVDAFITGATEAEIVLGEGRNRLLDATNHGGYSELDFGESGHFVPKLDMRRKMMSAEVDQHLGRLQACWPTIRPELDRLRLGRHNLAP